jgi:hypothetical protein
MGGSPGDRLLYQLFVAAANPIRPTRTTEAREAETWQTTLARRGVYRMGGLDGPHRQYGCPRSTVGFFAYQQNLDNLRRKDSLRGAETAEISVRLGNCSASHFEGSAYPPVGVYFSETPR